MIVHIVPTIPPDFNGLADYCFQLSRNWIDKGVDWGCLTLRIPAGAREVWPDAVFSHFEPSQQGLSEALDTLPIDILILHYVNYAYDAQGRPSWLPKALAEWKEKHPRTRLVIMFHELWAIQPPWRRSFWSRPAAKSIVRELAHLSDYWITSCQQYFDRVSQNGGHASKVVSKGAVIPIATNIEPVSPIIFQRLWPLFNGGKLKIAVFGLASTRNTALAMHSQLLRQLCAQNLVEQISVFGQKPQNARDNSSLEANIARIGSENLWHRAYDLSPVQASNLLRQHHVGIVKETVPLLTKSGVFAALCSHGVLPICVASNETEETPDSVFLTDGDVKRCVLRLQDKEVIPIKQQNIEDFATTSLNWDSVARSWMNHIEQIP